MGPGALSKIHPLVSMIIVNYNGKRFLDKCLSSVEAQTYRHFETILVDNGSTDGSLEFVKSRFHGVHIISNNENLGFSKANNVGISASRGAFIATLNNDTEARPRWLEALVDAMLSEDNVGMCASKMLFMNSPWVINSTGICISRSGESWDRGMFEPDRGQYDSIEEVFGPCAGAALYRRTMLDEVGLFDESFFAYMEDVDLAFRARLKGWKCLYVPDAVVYHHHGGTAGYMSDLSVYYGNRNIIWNFIKNYPAPLLLTSLIWVIGRNLAVLPYYALKGHGRAALRAKVDALKGLPAMVAGRAGGKSDVSRFIHTWARVPSPRKMPP
ncbi:glycosyltransferase family 2 protein [Methanocella conradii]|uniref:glycosyltransferase family 2 protein n=1 Tax=Methanocella conradii TaxID=1175444 RepID=UPI00157C8271|nr:glycosyltransferase family 2 protein [Methanocella conradii]